MKVLYLDCSSGISGDMFVGAMLDAGLNLSFLKKELSKLNIGGYKISKRSVMRNSIKGMKFDVLIDDKKHVHRPLKEILTVIEKSKLDKDVKELSKSIFLNIAKAEAKVHNVKDVKKVHFRELGHLDSIIDIVSASIAVKALNIGKVYGSYLNSGKTMPAASNLLEGYKVAFARIPYELITPTGAGIFTTLVDKNETPPPMEVLKTGYGAGTYEIKEIPNLLRVVVGDVSELLYNEDKVIVVETNIDDTRPIIYDYIMERLFGSGALDVFITSTHMKKSRIGALLTVLVRPSDLNKIAKIIFEETTTIGLRYYQANRFTLKREIKKVKTKYGAVNFKISKIEGDSYRLSPEYEDCRKLAKKFKVPLQEVYEGVLKER